MQTTASNNSKQHTTNVPAWVENNPYLPLLEKRFFNNPDLVDWSHLPLRVSRLFLTVEQRYEPISKAEENSKKIYDLVHEGAFFPNSPVMMNTETSNNVNLFACHVLAPPISVSALKVAEEIHDGCGGIGYDLSLQDNPVNLTRYIENQTDSLNYSRKRKAHSAVTLHVNHPQIESFVALGSELSITHTNVDLDKDFFSRLALDEPMACNLWKVICSSITRIGKPAISFSEHKAKRSPNGEPLINNVCGESLLRENESALIGSLNLTRFIIGQQFDNNKFAQAARLVVRCLDNFHDLQQHASPVVAARCIESRKIGVGIMGYADALLMLGIRYGSTEALAFADGFMSILRDVTTSESEILGTQRGSCEPNLLASDGNKIRRNASLMAIAANGTLSLIANVSGGIEPIFAYLIRQNVEGKAIYQIQPTLKKLLDDKGCDVDAIVLAMQSGIPVSEISAIDSEIRKNLVTAHDISFIDHITTQATFQKYIDGGISKTINLNHSTTESEISEAILYARNAGCVGISLYRDGSMNEQPTQMMEKR
jgi:ribonucleoside-diphosphate reductase alpha chain